MLGRDPVRFINYRELYCLPDVTFIMFTQRVETWENFEFCSLRQSFRTNSEFNHSEWIWVFNHSKNITIAQLFDSSSVDLKFIQIRLTSYNFYYFPFWIKICSFHLKCYSQILCGGSAEIFRFWLFCTDLVANW